MRHFLRGTTLALTLSSMLALFPACYAEVSTAPSAPPPPRVVQVAPRPGFIWVDGNWHWNGQTWVWMDGHYERMRHGHRWVPGQWVQQPNGAYQWVPGHWVR